jgi:hypothetical protein
MPDLDGKTYAYNKEGMQKYKQDKKKKMAGNRRYLKRNNNYA